MNSASNTEHQPQRSQKLLSVTQVHPVLRVLPLGSHFTSSSFTDVALEFNMVKRSATVLVCLFALSLAAFADRAAGLGPGENGKFNHIITRQDAPTPTNAVPEPGSLLLFGGVALLGLSLLKRKPIAC